MISMLLSCNLPTVVVGGAAFLLAVYLFRKRSPTGHMPPGPKGWPLYGNILDLKRWDVNGPGILDKWANEFGDIYSIQLGSFPAVILNSLETVKEAFIKQSDKTSGRATNVFFFRNVIKRAGTGIVLNEGQPWKDLRRAALHSLRDFGMGKKSLEERIQEEARALVDHLDTHADGPFDPRHMFNNAYSNVIVSIIFGDRCEYDDPEFNHLSDLLAILFRGGGFKNPEIFIPVLTPTMILFNLSLVSVVKVGFEIERLINTKIQRQKDMFDPDNIQSFVDIYLKAEMDGDISDTIAERNLFFTIMDLFLAGSETSSTTTRWVILYLIHNPDVQSKCQQVIKEAIGQERIPTGADRTKLAYVEATIREVQRMSTVAPYGVIHRAEEPVELSGYTVPKDTLIIANLHHIHMDPRHWKDPERFNPDRWIGPDGTLIKHEAFIPFGAGARECPGRNLALQEMFIIITSLLQKYTFKAKDPENPPKLAGDVGIVYVPNDYEITVERW